MADPTDIGIARKARAASEEADGLRAENARLVEMLDVLRAQTQGLAIKPPTDGKKKCYRCTAVYVDIKKRTVECQHCGSMLDPIEVIHEYAVKERNFLHANEHARKDLARLNAEIAALRAKGGNISALDVKNINSMTAEVNRLEKGITGASSSTRTLSSELAGLLPAMGVAAFAGITH